MNLQHSILICVLLAFSLTAFGCRDARNAKPAAEIAVAEFHERFNRGQIGLIYETAAANFRNMTSEDDFRKLMEAVTSKVGKVVSSENQDWNVRTFNLTTSIVLNQNTEFEKGSGVETFTFIINDGEPTLFGYYISSDDVFKKEIRDSP